MADMNTATCLYTFLSTKAVPISDMWMHEVLECARSVTT